MIAGISTSSTALVGKASNEGLKHLYRTILQQARLLSSTFNDPILFTSHRYLARANLSPLLTHPSSSQNTQTWPPSTNTKRIQRAQTQRRHLADANFGWEHAVYRSLSLAYARSGKLRRDALSDFSPQTSQSLGDAKHPKELRRKQFSPILLGLLTSTASMDGAPVKSVAHLTSRPPPPFLPSEDDPRVKIYGKGMGRRRVANAERRFVKTYMRKVKVPLDIIAGERRIEGEGEGEGSLFAHLEGKARPLSQYVVNYPTRYQTQGEGRVKESRQRGEEEENKPYLTAAREMIDKYRSEMNPSPHRSRGLRTHGWASNPKDYHRPRRQRRIYARILDDSPLLLLPSPSPTSTPSCTAQEESRGKDPLRIRYKLKQAAKEISTPTGEEGKGKKGGKQAAIKLKIVKSAHCIGPRSQRFETVPPGVFSLSQGTDEGSKTRREKGLNSSEKEFLKQMGML